MKVYQLNIEALKKRLSQDQTEQVLVQLLKQIEAIPVVWRQMVYLLASRWRSLQKEQMRRTIARADYGIEYNTIKLDLVTLLDQLTDGAAPIDPTTLLQQLGLDFAEARALDHTSSRLRAKNQISRQLGKLLVDYPHLWSELDLEEESVCNGICRKIIQLPDYGDLDWLEQIARRTESLFTLGNITNALAELIYAGKLNLGDDKRIVDILENLEQTADAPLLANVRRVKVALDYVVRGERRPVLRPQKIVVDATVYAVDKRLSDFVDTLQQAMDQGEKTVDFSFLATHLDKLFNRMTFRGEPRIEMCRSQRWTKRLQSALLTHHLLLEVEALWYQHATPAKQAAYHALLLAISQYVDAMVACLFENQKIEEAELQHLLGTAAFVSRFRTNGERHFPDKPGLAELDMPPVARDTINRYLGEVIGLVDGLLGKRS